MKTTRKLAKHGSCTKKQTVNQNVCRNATHRSINCDITSRLSKYYETGDMVSNGHRYDKPQDSKTFRKGLLLGPWHNGLEENHYRYSSFRYK